MLIGHRKRLNGQCSLPCSVQHLLHCLRVDREREHEPRLFWLQKEVPLGNPDVLVCSVGTEIFFEATGASPEANQEWKKELDQGWNRQEAIDAAAKFPDLKTQVEQQTHHHVLAIVPLACSI